MANNNLSFPNAVDLTKPARVSFVAPVGPKGPASQVTTNGGVVTKVADLSVGQKPTVVDLSQMGGSSSNCGCSGSSGGGSCGCSGGSSNNGGNVAPGMLGTTGGNVLNTPVALLPSRPAMQFAQPPVPRVPMGFPPASLTGAQTVRVVDLTANNATTLRAVDLTRPSRVMVVDLNAGVLATTKLIDVTKPTTVRVVDVAGKLLSVNPLGSTVVATVDLAKATTPKVADLAKGVALKPVNLAQGAAVRIVGLMAKAAPPNVIGATSALTRVVDVSQAVAVRTADLIVGANVAVMDLTANVTSAVANQPGATVTNQPRRAVMRQTRLSSAESHEAVQTNPQIATGYYGEQAASQVYLVNTPSGPKLACPPGTVQCNVPTSPLWGIQSPGSLCVDPRTSTEHCGTCGNQCPIEPSTGLPMECVNGICLSRPAFDQSFVQGVVAARPTTLGTWLDRGPTFGGRLDGIASSSSGNELFVASPGGGVWYTNDYTVLGFEWTDPSIPTSNPIADRSVFLLAWDPTPENRLFASTWSDLYATEDGGISWRNLTLTGGAPAKRLPPGAFFNPDPSPFAIYDRGVDRTVFWSKPGYGLFFFSVDLSSYLSFKPNLVSDFLPSQASSFIQSIAVDNASGFVYISIMGSYQNRTNGPGIFVSGLRFEDWPQALDELNNALLWYDIGSSIIPSSSGAYVSNITTSPNLAWRGNHGEITVLAEVFGANHSESRIYTGAIDYSSRAAVWSEYRDGSVVDVNSPVASVYDNNTTTYGPRPILWYTSGDGTVTGFIGGAHVAEYVPGVSNWYHISIGLDFHLDVRAINVNDTGKLFFTTDGSNSGSNIGQLNLDDLTPSALAHNPTPPCNEIDISGLSAWQVSSGTVLGDVSDDLEHTCSWVGVQDSQVFYSADQSATWNLSNGGIGGGVEPYAFISSSWREDVGYNLISFSYHNLYFANLPSAGMCGDVDWQPVYPYVDIPMSSGTPTDLSQQILSVEESVIETSTMACFDPIRPNRVYILANIPGVLIGTFEGNLMGAAGLGQMLNTVPVSLPNAEGFVLRPTSILVDPINPDDPDAGNLVYVGTASIIYAGAPPGSEGGGIVSFVDNLTSMIDDPQYFGLNGLDEIPIPGAVLAMAIVRSLDRSTEVFLAATTDGLYRKNLAVGGWDLVIGDGNYAVSCLAVDPHCPGTVYAGLGFMSPLNGVHRGGVLVSRDFGVSWYSLSAGYDLQNIPISGIQVDPLNSQYVHVRTWGRGVWVYDWGTDASACFP